MIKIVEIKNEYYFPIFKNGSSSIQSYAEKNKCKWLFDRQCGRAKVISIFIRDPKERFISGVHSFIEYEKRKFKDIDYETVLYLIKNHGLINLHFETQHRHLARLSEFFDGHVVLKGMGELDEVVGCHVKPRIPKISADQKTTIEKLIPDTIKIDYNLFDKIGRKELIRNVLS